MPDSKPCYEMEEAILEGPRCGVECGDEEGDTAEEGALRRMESKVQIRVGGDKNASNADIPRRPPLRIAARKKLDTCTEHRPD